MTEPSEMVGLKNCADNPADRPWFCAAEWYEAEIARLTHLEAQACANLDAAQGVIDDLNEQIATMRDSKADVNWLAAARQYIAELPEPPVGGTVDVLLQMLADENERLREAIEEHHKGYRADHELWMAIGIEDK